MRRATIDIRGGLDSVYSSCGWQGGKTIKINCTDVLSLHIFVCLTQFSLFVIQRLRAEDREGDEKHELERKKSCYFLRLMIKYYCVIVCE